MRSNRISAITWYILTVSFFSVMDASLLELSAIEGSVHLFEGVKDGIAVVDEGSIACMTEHVATTSTLFKHTPAGTRKKKKYIRRCPWCTFTSWNHSTMTRHIRKQHTCKYLSLHIFMVHYISIEMYFGDITVKSF